MSSSSGISSTAVTGFVAGTATTLLLQTLWLNRNKKTLAEQYGKFLFSENS